MSENQEESLQVQIDRLERLVVMVLQKTIKTGHTVDKNFSLLTSRIDGLHKKLDNLAIETGNDLGKVDVKLDGIHQEIKKIETVSRYTQEFEDILALSNLGKKDKDED